MNRTETIKRILLYLSVALSTVLCPGCSSAEAACPGGNCSVGFYSPWVGAWYYQNPCANGRCAVKQAAEPAEPTPAPENPAEFKPFCLRVLELINAQRQSAGLAPFTLDVSLCNGCESHSRYMQSNGFQHAYGIGGRECIAMGVRSPEAVVNMWLNSSGHRAILLGSGRIIGVGFSGVYWTLRVR